MSKKKFNIITEEENWKKAKIRATELGITLQEYWDRFFNIAFEAVNKKIAQQVLAPKDKPLVNDTPSIRHYYGPSGTGLCFEHGAPHRKEGSLG